MDVWTQVAVPLVVAGSSRRPARGAVGAWPVDKGDAERKMLVGLAHDRIIHLGMVYVDRGYITQDEYENLNDYLYTPYEKMGGNGSAKRVMEEVRKLPIRKI
jgi:hypothetical protein